MSRAGIRRGRLLRFADWIEAALGHPWPPRHSRILRISGAARREGSPTRCARSSCHLIWRGCGFGRAALVLVVTTGAAPVGAELLADPTRPADTTGAAGSAGVAYTGPVLQSTLISPYRKVAVIDGESCSLGDRVAGGVITEIRPYEVVLRTPGGRDVHLRLAPRLEKAAAKARSHEQTNEQARKRTGAGNE